MTFPRRWLILGSLLLVGTVTIWTVVGCGGGGSSGGGSANNSGGGGGGNNSGGGGGTDSTGNVNVESGYTGMFDGRSLNGWTYGKDNLAGQAATPDLRFQAQNGILVASAKDQAGNAGTLDIVSARDFNKDMVLKFDFRATQESSGYLTVRNVALPVGDYLRRGEQKHFQYFKTDGWNEMEVTIRLVTRHNNKVVTESDRLESSFTNGKATATLNGQAIDPNWIHVRLEGIPKCNGEVLYGGMFYIGTTGKIAFRTVSGKIALRNIRFQELP